MLWSFDELISEISKFFTLKIGDVIFTGTPSGVNKVIENDVFEGFIENKNVFKINIK
jgi:2-keto-4-pentenoate hydratase/2-oxohepta-3-ene-1,7-dioic acid hydratase in catechol pathway